MNRSPFPFRDFVRAKQSLVEAFVDGGETYAMLTGETGTGKTALLRELRSQLDRGRHRVLYFSAARKLGAAGLVKVGGTAGRAGLNQPAPADRCAARSSSSRRSTLRCSLPVVVMGSASTNSMSLGVS